MANCEQEQQDLAAAIAAKAATTQALIVKATNLDIAQQAFDTASQNQTQACANLMAAQVALEQCQQGNP